MRRRIFFAALSIAYAETNPSLPLNFMLQLDNDWGLSKRCKERDAAAAFYALKVRGVPDASFDDDVFIGSEEIFKPKGREDIAERAKALGWDIGFISRRGPSYYKYINQDNFLIRIYSEKVLNNGTGEYELIPTASLFAVLDGHGDGGHVASSVGTRVLTEFADSHFRDWLTLLEEAKAQDKQMENEGLKWDPKFRDTLDVLVQRKLYLMFEHFHKEYSVRPERDSGGTTLSVTIWDPISERLWVATAGDSPVFRFTKKNATTISAAGDATDPQIAKDWLENAEKHFGVPPQRYSYRDGVQLVFDTEGLSNPISKAQMQKTISNQDLSILELRNETRRLAADNERLANALEEMQQNKIQAEEKQQLNNAKEISRHLSSDVSSDHEEKTSTPTAATTAEADAINNMQDIISSPVKGLMLLNKRNKHSPSFSGGTIIPKNPRNILDVLAEDESSTGEHPSSGSSRGDDSGSSSVPSDDLSDSSETAGSEAAEEEDPKMFKNDPKGSVDDEDNKEGVSSPPLSLLQNDDLEELDESSDSTSDSDIYSENLSRRKQQVLWPKGIPTEEELRRPIAGFKRQKPDRLGGYASYSFGSLLDGAPYLPLFRLGGLAPSRSIGDSFDGSEFLTPQSFVRHDPTILTYDIPHGSIDALVLTSDGFSNPVGTAVSVSVWNARCSEKCKSNCIPDPLQLYEKWIKGNETLSEEYLDAHRVFSDTVNAEMDEVIFRIWQEAVEHTNRLLEKVGGKEEFPGQYIQTIVSTMYDIARLIDSQGVMNWHDDMTILVINRTEPLTHLASIEHKIVYPATSKPHIDIPSPDFI